MTRKILHALVGYLAVTSLPFYPFSFASPLAIDYDGYVQNHTGYDSALMKHVLDSIVETCQGVTMQNHSDTALMEHVPGDTIIIDARQEEAAGPSPLVPIVSVMIAAVIVGLSWLSDDNKVRGNGTGVGCTAL